MSDDTSRVIDALIERIRTAGRAGGSRAACQLQGLKGGARAYFIWRFLLRFPSPALIVCPTGKHAEALLEDLRFFHSESESDEPFARRVHYFPSWEVVPFEDVSPTADTIAARIEGLYHLQQTKNPVIVTTPEALLQRVPPRQRFAQRLRYLVEGDTVDLDALAVDLDDWGFRRVPLVEDRGDFSVRGGIIDVFPPAHPQPLRLELAGDLVESIREFDPVTQRSLEPRPELLILPVREFDSRGRTSREALKAIEERTYDLDATPKERNEILEGLTSGLLFPGVEFFLPYFYPGLDTVAEYLPPDTLIWLDGAGEVDAAVELARNEVERRAAERRGEHRFLPPADNLYLTASECRALMSARPMVELESLEMLAAPESTPNIILRSFLTRDLKIERNPASQEVSFSAVADRVREWAGSGHRVVLVATARPQSERLTRLFGNHDVAVHLSEGSIEAAIDAAKGKVVLTVGHLTEGFRLPDERLVIATEADIFGEMRQRRHSRRVEVTQLLKNLSELKPDDFVVHLDHGVGRYRGLKHLQVAGTAGDYLHLEYAGGDRLYLPVDRISLVQKYSGADGGAPALDKLGGLNWERVKRQTRESILAMAKELLDIYAHREMMEGKAFRAPEEYYAEFEAAFPFEETPDQQRAVDDVLLDLQKAKAMDRLICGDVGYGKTEVAMRAAFLSVLSGHQVAVLVPTTVLAQQHYNTFCARFQGYPVRVAQLSRFLTKTETQEVIGALKHAKVDIVVGTHRLLQKDVEFRDLGLLVVDEEHRFGVRHKERIKQMRKLVHVMTLTATPIPRTLQMSLLGIRDLSVIETPPIDRLAIRTYVTRHDEGIIREAIQRELSREGQVFYVYNRVETIEIMARRLRELVPEARTAVAHGQMHERELERVMGDFFAKKTSVLVCSAIIESGIDVPNANTIIIDRADHFGLAQLYQLRGRVGRSHERAYAYLMIPGEQMISREAQLRLRALQELDDLGGGFKLAAHDLEIRGAGNLLGKQQSGHITAVGFELYQQMMEDAVQELRGQQVRHEIEPEIQLGIPAFVPGTYIPDEEQRLVFYRRLAGIRSQAELEEIAAEMRDRFGPIPPLADNFLRVMDLRRYLKTAMVVRAALIEDAVTLQFHQEAPVNVDKLVELVRRKKDRYRLSQDHQLTFRPEAGDWDGLIEETKGVLQELHEAC